jgi:ABC-type Zn uptake system ZnuABC Zn-binding protein ZnuA
MRKSGFWMGVIRVLGAAAIGLAGCSAGGDPWAERPGPKVLAFFPPIYSLAATVAGDDAQVLSLLTSRGPHDYEPRPSDARKLRRAALFLVNGLELDDLMAAKLAETTSNKHLRVVKLGERIPKESLLEAGLCTDPSHNHDHAHSHGTHDPHVWLGVPEAIHMAEAIRDELTQLDPQHADGYKQRTAALTDRLRKLQAEGQALLKAKKEKARMLTHHDALRYFARSFGAEVAGAIEMPGREPSAKRLNELVDLCKKEKVRLIAVEPQYPSHTGAQALLRELQRKDVPDAAFVELDTLETADPADLTPDFLERKLRANLDNLVKALQ